MQCWTGRQLVTGLTANNIRPEYYRQARAMCHSLFQIGAYYRNNQSELTEETSEAEKPAVEAGTLNQLQGILSHIHYVKDRIDVRDDLEKKKEKTATAARKLYAKFLFYRYFVQLDRPIVICEGKTDNVYLKYAIRNLDSFHPMLGSWSEETFGAEVSFFNYSNQAHDVLDLGGGTGDLKSFFRKYEKKMVMFGHRPLAHPVIVLIDNDDGAKDIFALIKEITGQSISHKTSSPFRHVAHNLYLVKTPESGESGRSGIEDFFDPALLETKLDGKKFNPDKKHGATGEYGNVIFAEKVVRPNADKIDFSKFDKILQRIVAVIEDYSPPTPQKALPPTPAALTARRSAALVARAR